MWKNNFDINNLLEYEDNNDSDNYGQHFSTFNNILIMLSDIIQTQCANKLLHALIARSTNSASRWIWQSWSFIQFLSSDVIIFMKIPIYWSFLKSAFSTFSMLDIMAAMWVCEAQHVLSWYFNCYHSISDKVK
jgi:hypothetical protein